MVDLTSSTLVFMFSLWVSREGNLPALFSPGPRIRGICLIRDSEARKASYFLAKKTQWETRAMLKKKIVGVKSSQTRYFMGHYVNFIPSFLTSFLFLLSFLRASMSMCGSSAALASSQCCWSPRTHTENFGLGRVFSLRINKTVKHHHHHHHLEVKQGMVQRKFGWIHQ